MKKKNRKSYRKPKQSKQSMQSGRMREWNLPPPKRVRVAPDESQTLSDKQRDTLKNITGPLRMQAEEGATPPSYNPSFFSNSTATLGIAGAGATNNTNMGEFAAVIFGGAAIFVGAVAFLPIVCKFFNKPKSTKNLDSTGPNVRFFANDVENPQDGAQLLTSPGPSQRVV